MDTSRADLVALSKKYPGRWVALDSAGSVVADGGSAHEVLEAAEAEGIPLPLVVHVLADYGKLVPWRA